MPKVQIVFFRDKNGYVPMVTWLDSLAGKPRAKCINWLSRLEDSGHELRRPYADTLRDGIHELRVRFESVNYRMLYFFHGVSTAVVTHGIIKEREIPEKSIQHAINMRDEFRSAPKTRTFFWEINT